jgi:ribosomal protein L11 methyltransferase
MTSYKLSARTETLALAEAMTAALEVLEPPLDAVTQFEDGPGAWIVEAYAQDRATADIAARQIGSRFAEAGPALAVEELPSLNWVAVSQAALPPVIAGPFVVHGSHDRHRIPYGPRSILIDAGEAFGTAHHGTTLGCLIAIDRLAHTGLGSVRRVLDLGCGSGVLAIAAARTWPRADVLATDIDPIAIDVARANADANGARRIETVVATGLDHPWLRQAAPFDVIIANILAGPLRLLAGDIARSLRPGGFVILSGILTPEAAKVLAAYNAHGFSLLRHRRIGEWSTLTLRRRG